MTAPRKVSGKMDGLPLSELRFYRYCRKAGMCRHDANLIILGRLSVLNEGTLTLRVVK